MSNKGKLFLIPNVIAEDTQSMVIPNQVRSAITNVRYFVVEDVRTARRFLSSLRIFESIESLKFEVLNKDTDPRDVPKILEPILHGELIGVISESGCPGVADPGALAVRFAHDNDVPVIPLVGPSSLLLALMSSGLNGQKFAFHGYLPIDAKELARTIKNLEEESRKHLQTQMIIETPYRNNHILKALLDTLHPRTSLCIASDITGSGEFVKTRSVESWRLQRLELPKKPAVYLFLA